MMKENTYALGDSVRLAFLVLICNVFDGRNTLHAEANSIVDADAFLYDSILTTVISIEAIQRCS